MTIVRTGMAAMAVALLGAVASAEEGVSHYEPLPSDTLAQALENFNAYNAMMAEILARGDLAGQDMEDIHELTYTLEVALAKINEELGALPVVLESVHLASEGDNVPALRAVAEVYLETAGVLAR